MQRNFIRTSQITLTIVLFIVVSLINNLDAEYNGECWVVSNGDTVRRLYPDGNPDPTVIPNLTQAQTAEVNPRDGTVWIAVSAANTVYKYNPSSGEFIAIPNIKRPHSVSLNPVDGAAWIGGLDVVVKVSADGQVLATIPGVYEPEVAVNLTDGSCWVTDSRGKVARYDSSGALAVTSPVKLTEPKYVTVNSKTGNAWVADTQAGILVKLDANGRELLRLADIPLPISPRVNSQDGSLWVVADSSSLIKLSADGQKIKEIPNAGMIILAISVDPKDGSLWVADQLGSTFQGEVSKFSATGKKLFGQAVPIPSYVSVGYWAGE
jgi:streptogramin lyase